MTRDSSLLLFAVMATLAAMPSVSTLAVVSRSAAFGFTHGLATTTGILFGDLLFLSVALLSLSVFAEMLGHLSQVLFYLAGGYLIMLGALLWRSAKVVTTPSQPVESSLRSSFLLGLLITIGDQKALLFYLGLLPAFVDLAAISWQDASLVIGVTLLAVGGVKLTYALLADKLAALIGPGGVRGINRLAGSVLTGIGVFLIVGVWTPV